jgi:hypothetical protein
MHVVGHELRFWNNMRENIDIVCYGGGADANAGAGVGAGAVACEDC